MKTMFIKQVLISVVAGFAVSCALPLRAAGTNTVVQSKVSGQHIQTDITKWDLNENGHLDADELKSYQRDVHQQRVQHLEAQRKAVAAMRREQLARQGIPRLVPQSVLSQYDLNKNGIMDLDEWEQYRAAQAAKHGTAYTPTNPHGQDARIVAIPAKPVGK